MSLWWVNWVIRDDRVQAASNKLFSNRLDNGVMTTMESRSLLSLSFACLYISELS